jgi:chromosome partitioning protein
MTARVVAFVNFKGGVGKTANVVNIGACLAATHQKRVLVVDLDAQCNTSLWLLRKPQWRAHTEDGKRSVAQLFKDKVLGTRLFRFQDAIIRGVPFDSNGFRLIGSLHLLPAVLELIEIEEPVAARMGKGSYRYLFDALTPHTHEYDYILLDCPPNFFAITKNAVFFAGHLAIPYIPDFLSLAGFQQLANLVEGFGSRIGGNKTALGRTRISAIVVNRYKKIGNVYKQGLHELDELMRTMKEQKLIHEKAKVLEPPIRDSVEVAEAPAEHLPILLHAPKGNGTTDYAALTESFLNHYEALL